MLPLQGCLERVSTASKSVTETGLKLSQLGRASPTPELGAGSAAGVFAQPPAGMEQPPEPECCHGYAGTRVWSWGKEPE